MPDFCVQMINVTSFCRVFHFTLAVCFYVYKLVLLSAHSEHAVDYVNLLPLYVELIFETSILTVSVSGASLVKPLRTRLLHQLLILS